MQLNLVGFVLVAPWNDTTRGCDEKQTRHLNHVGPEQESLRQRNSKYQMFVKKNSFKLPRKNIFKINPFHLIKFNQLKLNTC